MIELLLVGIGTGNPDHLTREAIKALNSTDLILIPRKGPDKSDLATLRQSICQDAVTNPGTRVVLFDLPHREDRKDYIGAVSDWHDAIAGVWHATIMTNLGAAGRVAFLVWGDPSLYDSTLRIAERVGKILPLTVKVIPGITALQALTAAHAIPINDLARPFTVTTGRQLRDHGWPEGATTVAVMLDGECSFQRLDPAGYHIWWSAYAGMAEEINISGPLAEVGSGIIERRAAARAEHGWIMDIYILRRSEA